MILKILAKNIFTQFIKNMSFIYIYKNNVVVLLNTDNVILKKIDLCMSDHLFVVTNKNLLPLDEKFNDELI